MELLEDGKETSRMDGLLLKGFYTSNRNELGNPPLADRKKKSANAKSQIGFSIGDKLKKSAIQNDYERHEMI